MIWNLNKIQYPVYNLGPGKRLGIWVQGCSIHCEGCINALVWDKEHGKRLPVTAVYEIVNHLCKGYDGITITGGEPFDQYPQLMAFAMLLKRKTALSILCYSGYSLNELETRFPDRVFYQCIDFLVDGRYEKNRPSGHSLKGSENQNIYALTSGKAAKQELNNMAKTWSLKCENHTVYMAGIPGYDEMSLLARGLQSSGIHTSIV